MLKHTCTSQNRCSQTCCYMTRMMSSKMGDSSFDAMDKVHGAMDRPEGQKQNINSKHIFEGA